MDKTQEQPDQTTMTTQPRPTPAGFATWNDYWVKEYKQPWRTEPEIDEGRQQYLAERRAIVPDIEQGIYPFKDVKLGRADVEWLLATHESGGRRGPVDWSDPLQREREGLDLRGVNVQHVDLSELPLACTRFGLLKDELPVLLLERPDLELPQTYWGTEEVGASVAQMEDTNLERAHLERASLALGNLKEANLRFAHLEGAFLCVVRLEQAALIGAHFEDAFIRDSNLQRVLAIDAHFERADLRYARLEGRSLFFGAHFEDADLRAVVFSDDTALNGAWLGSEYDGVTRLADVRWNGANLALVRWVQPRRGRLRRTRAEGVTVPNKRAEQLLACQRSLRANRQLAAVLRSQGLSDQADRFTYRAQQFQRQVNRLQHRPLRFSGSFFLDLISGYGYKPLRSLIAYIVIICAFAGAYLVNAQFASPHLTWDEALVLSVSAFHGRGFFTSGISLGDTLARLAAGEAIIGLLIEITFIATFTQRFFAR